MFAVKVIMDKVPLNVVWQWLGHSFVFMTSICTQNTGMDTSEFVWRIMTISKNPSILENPNLIGFPPTQTDAPFPSRVNELKDSILKVVRNPLLFYDHP
ncbi:MAG: hypothetical protein ACYCSO_00750 [Cuniculiplasma sp.]